MILECVDGVYVPTSSFRFPIIKKIRPKTSAIFGVDLIYDGTYEEYY